MLVKPEQRSRIRCITLTRPRFARPPSPCQRSSSAARQRQPNKFGATLQSSSPQRGEGGRAKRRPGEGWFYDLLVLLRPALQTSTQNQEPALRKTGILPDHE